MKIKKKVPIIVLIFVVMLFPFNSTRNIRSKAATVKLGEEVTFFVATDTHYLASDLTDNGEAFQTFVNEGDGKQLTYIQEIMNAFENDIEKKNPNVLVISGDLTSNGEKKGHLEFAKRLEEIEKLGTSVYVIPGNHDILNPYARRFEGRNQYKTDYISPKDFSNIYKNFGYKEAISKDETTLSYLAAPSEEVWLLMLDTAKYENNIDLGHPELNGRIASETLNWIKQCSDLAKSKDAEIIAVMHHNLLNHSSNITKGFTIDNSEEVIELFKQCDINLALSGHIHLQDIKSNEDVEKPIYDIATGCISVYPQKYGILKYSRNDGINYITESVDVEGWSKEVGIVDENINNFNKTSKTFYGDRLYSKIMSRLAITDLYTEEELNLMADTYRTLYLRYYEGMREIATEEIKNSPGFKLWLNNEFAPSQKNVIRLANTHGENNNNLFISNKKTSN
ncbi:metallophosphoesterase [Clostridium sp.]|uniref:metallophosphoesterase n=1 Tax=Clostridium sp. TaxID=1506 RepID=UPI002FCC9656